MVVSFIGLGEVGSAYSTGLAGNGVRVKGYDLKFHDAAEKDKFLPYGEAGVELVKSPEELITGSDIILAVTSCTQAIETAEMYKPFLKKGQIYIEMNSAVPSIKEKVRTLLAPVCEFVDGATLCSPSQFGVATPLVMSGELAREASDKLNAAGMNIKYLGDRIGQASAYKVIRSIFTKSLESCLIETMHAARKYGIAEEVFESVVEFLAGEPTDETLALMVRTNVLHAKRRGDEIAEISEMLEEDGLDNSMAAAAARKLYWLSSLGMKERFKGRKADSMYEVVDALLDIQH